MHAAIPETVFDPVSSITATTAQVWEIFGYEEGIRIPLAMASKFVMRSVMAQGG